ncbi:hypothetical protein Dimus_020122 [Dionaea muscipula]
MLDTLEKGVGTQELKQGSRRVDAGYLKSLSIDSKNQILWRGGRTMGKHKSKRGAGGMGGLGLVGAPAPGSAGLAGADVSAGGSPAVGELTVVVHGGGHRCVGGRATSGADVGDGVGDVFPAADDADGSASLPAPSASFAFEEREQVLGGVAKALFVIRYTDRADEIE